MSNDFYCILYCSQLAQSAPFNAVPDIIRTARRFNASNDVTGILVFDGVNFLQHLEGPDIILVELITRIARDSRHVNFRLQYQGRGFGKRRFRSWSMAYAHIEDDEPLKTIQRLEGREAMMHFSELVPSLEIAP